MSYLCTPVNCCTCNSGRLVGGESSIIAQCERGLTGLAHTAQSGAGFSRCRMAKITASLKVCPGKWGYLLSLCYALSDFYRGSRATM